MIDSHRQNERHLNHAEIQCPSQRRMNDQAIQCELIGRTPDTRSIGSGTDTIICSAKTGESLQTSQMAQNQVDKLFDGKENKMPSLKSRNFKSPREIVKKNEPDGQGFESIYIADQSISQYIDQ